MAVLAHLGGHRVNLLSRSGQGLRFRCAARAVSRNGAPARFSRGAVIYMALPINSRLLGQRAVIVNRAPYSVSQNFAVRPYVEALGVIRSRLNYLVAVAVDLGRVMLREYRAARTGGEYGEYGKSRALRNTVNKRGLLAW